MKFARVVGRVTLSACVPSLAGGRWLVVAPMTGEMLAKSADPSLLGAEPTPVVYDDLGAWQGDIVAFVDGREAAMPFDHPTPIDAYNCAIVDRLDYRPHS